jgi:hypothetical protein
MLLRGLMARSRLSVTVAPLLVVAALGFVVARPATAAAAGAFERSCYCENTYCQDTGGGSGFRWCCDWDGEEWTCGCTLYVVNCIET